MSDDVSGFVIGGLHRFGQESERFEMKEVKNMLQETMVSYIAYIYL